MNEIGAFEAKNKLGQLLDRVERGEEIVITRHGKPVAGCGRFNPLTPIDRKGVLDDSWKTTPHIDQMMADVRRVLGNMIADYFWNGDYAKNLFAERTLSKAA